MPHRIIWWAAVALGVAYYIAVQSGSGALDVLSLTLLKGSGVAALTLWVFLSLRGRECAAIVSFFALCALGDMALNLLGVVLGGVAFALAHLFAIYFFWRHKRPDSSKSQRLLGVLVVPMSLLIGIALLGTTWDVLPAFVYLGLVAMMASAAWMSRFPRYRTGIGAMLFLFSDLLIFAQFSLLAQSSVPELLIWPLYFAGQALIAHGVVTTLRAMPKGA